MSDIDTDVDSPNTMVFDPDQDPQEKRVLRQNYRSLAKNLEEHQSKISEFTPQQLLDQVKRADMLFNKVKGPQEATLDSHLLLMASNVGAQKARAMKSGSGAFDVDDFISKLLKFIGGQKILDASDFEEEYESDNGFETLDWSRVGRQVMAKSRRAPVTSFMLGPLYIEQKSRASSKRSKLEKNKDEERRPTELKEEDISRSQNETTKNVATISALLLDQGEINLFKFVINPQDFAQSVENIFYLSFLIRDGKVAMHIVDGEPLIYACESPNDEDYQNGLKKQQLVLEFDMAVWKRAIEVFQISEAIIPKRPPSETKLGKWMG